MKLILEIIKAPPEYNIADKIMQFDTSGGKIGRNQNAKWVLADHTKHISNFHAEVSFNKGRYYLTDISSNGVFFKNPHKKFVKGIPMPLTEGNIIIIGIYEIAVKAIDSSFIDNPTGTTLRDDNFLADDTFTDNQNSEALDILKVETNDSTGILSFLDTDIDKQNEILPNLDTIMGIENNEDEEENVVTHESLSMHIDINDIQEDNPPSNTDKQNANLIKIFALKLGVDLESKSQKEQELFVTQIADLVSVLFEEAHTTANSLENIKSEIGFVPTNSATPFVKTSQPNVLLENIGVEEKPLSVHLKNLFHSINTHNTSFLKAYNNIALQTAQQFSPEKLYFSFEKNNKLDKAFTNKKAQAWEAYAHNFKYLDNFEAGRQVMLEELRKEYLVILNTINLNYNR